jgi:hypothetical protein
MTGIADGGVRRQTLTRGVAPELKQPVLALSLAGLRRRIEDLMVPDSITLRPHLDRRATQERDQRRYGQRAMDARMKGSPKLSR